jgi:hypothetical protein
MRKCSYCGRENDDETAYCGGCGTPTVESQERGWQPRPGLSIFALASAGLGCTTSGIAVLISLQFFAVARGESVRAMGWAGFIFMLAAAGLVAGVPCGIVGLLSPRPWLALLGTVLSLTPWPLGSAILHAAASVKGFQLSP